MVTLNKFSSDTDAEIEAVTSHCRAQGWRVAINNVWGAGGGGGQVLAETVLEALDTGGDFRPIYEASLPLAQKLETLARSVYGANGVEIGPDAQKALQWLTTHGFDRLPVCVAKTQYSLSDDASLRGAPTGFVLHVRDFTLSAGAGFVVALTGDIMTMPGLPKKPAANDIDIDADGVITGLF